MTSSIMELVCTLLTLYLLRLTFKTVKFALLILKPSVKLTQ